MRYRRDIDGLRAVAVLGVVFYHFGLPGFGGGFVGVDIFFVISGFLIGGLLVDELRGSGRIALARFFARRIRRLAPAYGAMVLASCAVGWLLLLPYDFRELGKSVIAATVYLSNLLFYRQAGYFDGAAEEKVLLHTWSLAVEEQFYILFPLLLLFLWRLRLSLAPWLAALAMVSLLACLWITPRDPSAAFYLIPFRAWQLLAGVLLALWLRRVGEKRVRWAGMAGLAGLVLVAVSVVLTRPGAGFPGWQAVVPVLGAALLIAAGARGGGPATRWLAAPLPVGIGLISYSLYLWHWPVLVLASLSLGEAAETVAARTALMAFSFALATASWAWIEQPLRRAPRLAAPRVALGAGALASVLLLALGGWLFRGEGHPQRFDARTRLHIAAAADFLQDWSRCATASEGPLAGIEVCRIGPEDAPAEVLVWGDSHLRAWSEGIARAAQDAGVGGLLIWRAGCPPLFGIEKTESAARAAEDRACAEANTRIRAALPGLASVRRVLLVARWTYYAEGRGSGLDAGNRIEVRPGLAAALDTTVAELAPRFERIFLLRQPPEIPGYDSRIAARRLARGASLNGAESVPRTALSARFAAADAALAAVARGPVRVIDPWPAFCDDQACQALGPEGGRYFDNNHVTNSAALAHRAIFAPLFAIGDGS